MTKQILVVNREVLADSCFQLLAVTCNPVQSDGGAGDLKKRKKEDTEKNRKAFNKKKIDEWVAFDPKKYQEKFSECSKLLDK